MVFITSFDDVSPLWPFAPPSLRDGETRLKWHRSWLPHMSKVQWVRSRRRIHDEPLLNFFSEGGNLQVVFILSYTHIPTLCQGVPIGNDNGLVSRDSSAVVRIMTSRHGWKGVISFFGGPIYLAGNLLCHPSFQSHRYNNPGARGFIPQVQPSQLIRQRRSKGAAEPLGLSFWGMCLHWLIVAYT